MKRHKTKSQLKRIWLKNLRKARAAVMKKSRRHGHRVRHSRRRGR